MKKLYLLLTFIGLIFIINSCSDDEQTEIINTDISVTTITDKIIYDDIPDIETKLNQVLSYDYGNALESELNITREYNDDYTRVIVSINFKSEFTSKYNDQNPSNNIVVIDLEESTEISFEGNDSSTDFNLGSDPWISCNITFSFFNHTSDLSEQEQEEAFLQAGEIWTSQIPGMEFINLGQNNNNAILRIDFSNNINHPPCPKNFTSSNTIAHAFWPIDPNWPVDYAGDIHFNDNYTYTNGSSAVTQTDFISIAVHEIGHSLGIAHNPQLPNAIMYPSYSNGSIKRNLSQDDINAINALYFNNCSGNAFSNISLSSDIDFGNVQINTNSNAQTLTVSNTGNSSFNITNISSSNNAFTILNGQSTSVAPNSSVDFDIQFSPSNEQSYNGVITVDNTADNANSSNSSIQVSGVGVNNNSSAISISGNLNFGDVEIGQSNTRNFTISNTGNQSFNVSSISFPSGVYSANWNSGTINAGGSQNVTVTFQPTNVQSYNGTVTVNHNADSGNNTISISGNGINNNQNVTLSYNDHLVKDGTGGGVGNSNGIAEAGEEIDLDVRLINTGNATVTNVSAILSTNDSDINITDNSVNWGDISAGSTDWGVDFDFDIDANCPTKTVTFNLQITSDQGSWNDSFTVNIQSSSGGNPISITPANGCSTVPLMQVNTEYIVNINTANYSPASPIDGHSAGGNNVRGFWVAFQVPSDWDANHDFKIYDVSSNFDPVFGIRANCNGPYLGHGPVGAELYIDDNGNGGNETSDTNLPGSTSSDNIYHVRIYHYNGSETPTISFKMIVE